MNLQKHVSLNINVRGLGESPTLAINERVKLLLPCAGAGGRGSAAACS
ncbi:hypothetical protein [Methanothrix sp.]|nr:hypothetical protein [Methanothrix sp.]